jgi:hypothetical protein
MPREGGASSRPRPSDSITAALEYWVTPVEPGDDVRMRC